MTDIQLTAEQAAERFVFDAALTVAIHGYMPRDVAQEFCRLYNLGLIGGLGDE